MPAEAASGSPGSLLDLTPSIGSFFMVSKQKKLFALQRIGITRDFTRIAQSVFTSEDFAVLYPLVARLRSAGTLLVVHPPQVYYLTRVGSGGARRTHRVFGSTADIIAQSLDNGLFPVLSMAELERALIITRRNKTPLTVGIRLLELKASLPESWLGGVKKLFEINTVPAAEKADRLSEQLAALAADVRHTQLSAYLMKCMWLDVRSRQFGTLSERGGSVEFQPYPHSDPELRTFLSALVEHEDGSYESNDAVGEVLPGPVRGSTWSCPTLHIRNPKFRTINRLDEHYSVYKGLKLLCGIGAPVLLYQGQNPLLEPSRVSLLRVSSATDVMFETSAREFPARALVWDQPATQMPGTTDEWTRYHST